MKTPFQRIHRGAFLLLSVFVVAVIGFRVLGGYDWMSAIWMVVITISTVGYGEQSTFGPALQLFTVFVIVIGMSASVYTFGGLIQLMLEGEIDRALGRRRMLQEIERMKDHIIICGFGRMGRQLAAELQGKHCSLVVVDSDTAIDDELHGARITYMAGDATDEDVLLSVGVKRARTLVVSLPSDAESVFVTLTARNLNPDLQIIARAEQKSTEKKLRQAGANRIVMPAVIGARQMARMITRPSTADLMELASEREFVNLELDEIEIVGKGPLVGLSILETQAHKRYKLLIIAIKHADGQLTFNPSADHRLLSGDILIMMGHAEDIQNFCVAYGIRAIIRSE